MPLKSINARHRSRGFGNRLKGLPEAHRWRVGGLVLSLLVLSTFRSAPEARRRRDCEDRGRLCLRFFGSTFPGAPRAALSVARRRTTMAQLAATQPVTALRPHTPPPIAAPMTIRPGEKTRGVFGSWSEASSSGTRSSPPINVPRPDDDDDDEAAAVSQQDSLYEYRRYLFWLRLRRGGIAGGDYEAENGDPPPRRSRSPPLSSSYRRALSKPPTELFQFDL